MATKLYRYLRVTLSTSLSSPPSALGPPVEGMRPRPTRRPEGHRNGCSNSPSVGSRCDTTTITGYTRPCGEEEEEDSMS
jgi:hypothetical protein